MRIAVDEAKELKDAAQAEFDRINALAEACDPALADCAGEFD
jgi:hypothetical protein